MTQAQLLAEIRRALQTPKPQANQPSGWPVPRPPNPYYVRTTPRCYRSGAFPETNPLTFWHSTPTFSEFRSFNGKLGLLSQ